MSHSNAGIDSFFPWQGQHAVLYHYWLNYLLQTGEYISSVSEADGDAMGFG